MRVTVSKNYEELCKKVCNFMIEDFQKLSSPLLCFAGGETPLGIFKYLIKLVKNGIISFDQTHFISLDEWVDLDASDQGSCRNTLDKYLFGPLNIKKSSIYFFNGKSKDLLQQCLETNRYLENRGPIDLVLLGIGINGHIGFNEPGSTLNSICRLVSLDESTRNIGQKYFNFSRKLNQGITLGLKQILEARTAVLIASGKSKRNIVKTLLKNRETDLSFPVSSLWQHSNCFLFVDEEAYF